MIEKPLKFDAGAQINALPRERLESMAAAGAVIEDSYRALEKAGANVVGQCLRGQGTFYELDHYPKGDVYDNEFHSQYYYHAHRPDSGEHGHFHTFLRANGMPRHIKPVPYSGKAKRPMGTNALSHFVAISMSRPGFPIGLFTTNRWVTDETFYGAEDVISLLDRFEVYTAFPCLAVNRWITAMLNLFRPQIAALVRARDVTITEWAALHPGIDVYEDRDLEITSIMPIDVREQTTLVRAALERV